jgi:DNA-3-methyladenine glycosylase II
MPQHPDRNSISFTLKPVAPFRLDYTVWALRRRPVNTIDRWDGTAWRRVHELAGGICEIRVIQAGPPENPILRVAGSGKTLTSDAKTPITNILTRMLGLETDLSGFYDSTRQHRTMAALAERFRGVRLPIFPTIFEALVNGIACQQLSLTVGIILLNRLAESYGARLSTPEGTAFGFPRPEKLAGADIAGLKRLGFSRQKAQALIELSNRVSNKAVDLPALEAMGNAQAVEMLLELRGIGRWTADYALLRGMGRFMIFPAGDVGARNRLQDVLHISKPLDEEGIRKLLRRWDSYAGLVYLHLLLAGLADEGHL